MDTRKVRIMIVEDEYIIAEDIKRSLESFGYEVVATADSGREAIEAAIKTVPSLILMDIMLRGEMDGIQAAGIISGQISIPVIFLTSFSNSQMLERAKTTEPFAYMLKPFRDWELQAAIEMALYKHSLQKRLKESEHWLSTTLNSIGVGVVTTNPLGYVTFINLVGLSLTGLTKEESIGRSLIDLFSFVDQLTGAAEEPAIKAVIREKKPIYVADHNLVVNASGKSIPVSEITSPILGENDKLLGVAVSFQDRTERHRLENELRLMSLTDELTGLNNRRGFMLLVEQQLKVVRRLGSELAILFIDMDGMKWINDTYGHKEGDRALADTAAILRETFRDADIIARIGGDEFVVVVTDANGVSDEELSWRLHNTAALHNEVNPGPYKISLSAGIVRYDPLNHEAIETLIDRADKLMYEEKNRKR
ncbi:MAG: diguanylate cyclase [Nitrospirae bacterium]|nr:diguanylate cyclase [Nitrospirota bacterium]